jgi:hypothetical protein
MGQQTVLGFIKEGQDKGKPIFSRNGGMTLRNATGVNTQSFGYQRAIDTLTYIKTQITEQKFYRVNIADYMPVVVGEGSFSQDILTNQTLSTSGDFEEGNINQGSNNAQLATADVAVTSQTVQVINWAKSISYTLIEIEQALQSNNWDLIASKHNARKENWDLGLQQIAMLGSLNNNAGVPGLLNQPNVTVNTSLIQQLINSMTVTQFTSLVAGVVENYRSNSNRTSYPTHWVIPEDDYNGMTVPYSSAFPVISQIKYLTDSFAALGMPGLKIMPSAYAIPANNTAWGINKHVYMLYNYDPRSIRMDVPVMITSTQPNTLNNFQFQDAAYGQYTGLWSYRILEMYQYQF